jgi:hypothetical protein
MRRNKIQHKTMNFGEPIRVRCAGVDDTCQGHRKEQGLPFRGQF